MDTKTTTKSNYVYHYTSFKNFLKIWSNKKLKFAESSGLNDINEVSKFYFGQHNPHGFTNTKALEKEVALYKQISLVRETVDLYNHNNKTLACMSPTMWGHYGDKGKGVCIRLNLSDINFSNKIFRGMIFYERKMPQVEFDNPDIASFIKKYKKILFFTKTKDWSYENEYRIVSKEEDFLDISNAISEIIITTNFGTNKNNKYCGGFESALYRKVLKPIISDEINVLEFCPNGLNDYFLKDEEGNQIYPYHGLNVDFSE